MSIPDASGKPVAKVTLACSSDHERCAYSQDEVYYTVVDRIQSLDPAVPVHYILGERADLMCVPFSALRPLPMLTTAPATPRRPSPEYIPQSVMGVRTPASVQKVPDAGHFVCLPFLCSCWC